MKNQSEYCTKKLFFLFICLQCLGSFVRLLWRRNEHVVSSLRAVCAKWAFDGTKRLDQIIRRKKRRMNIFFFSEMSRFISTCMFVTSGIIGLLLIILLPVFLTQYGGITKTNISTTTTTTTTSTASTSSSAPTVWPDQYSIPLGFYKWRIILETSTNISTLNAIGQELTTNANGYWLWIESLDNSRQFNIALNLTMSSPHLAYYSTTEIPNPVFISLIPDLIHSNSQCILQIRTYPSQTRDFSNTHPETTLFFILQIVAV